MLTLKNKLGQEIKPGTKVFTVGKTLSGNYIIVRGVLVHNVMKEKLYMDTKGNMSEVVDGEDLYLTQSELIKHNRDKFN